MKTALVAGHTGLIGSQLLSNLLASEYYDKVIAIGRRHLNIEHPKLVQITVDFDNIDLEEQKVDHVFCALGTTMKKAGSKDKFRLVDFQYPVNMAGYFLKKGAQRFLLVSSMGADENSGMFYNQVKGEVENAISKLGYPRLDVFRPSLLLGPRGESRVAEDIGKGAMKLFGFLFVGPLKDYGAIESSKVAAAMLYFAQEEGEGSRLHLSGELQYFN